MELSLAARWGRDPAGNTLQGKACVFGHRGVQFVRLVQAGGGVRAAEGWTRASGAGLEPLCCSLAVCHGEECCSPLRGSQHCRAPVALGHQGPGPALAPALGLAGAGGASRRGALEAGPGCALAPCGIWESVDLPRATGERAAQAPPSPLVSASPGPRFCQPSAYQQEAKRLPESEVWTPGLRGASGAPCPPPDAPGSSGH